MTSPVTASKAKTELLTLLTRVESGETITITRHGKPVAYLGPVSREHLHVQSAENDEPMPSGVLRPAPGAADQFAEHVQPAVSEQAPQTPPPMPEDSPGHKKTAPGAEWGDSPLPASALAPRPPPPKPLTLADIIRAGAGQS